jgi:hypothetical protein
VFKLGDLWHGLPGHPLHPPLTDATIGTYTAATALALADVTGLSMLNLVDEPAERAAAPVAHPEKREAAEP